MRVDLQAGSSGTDNSRWCSNYASTSSINTTDNFDGDACLAAAVSLQESVVLKQKSQMKSCLKKYKKLHQELQLKRVVESKSMNFEIKSLRQMISLLQQEVTVSHAMLSDE